MYQVRTTLPLPREVLSLIHSVTAKTPWVYESDAKEVQFHYNDSSAPFYSFVFLVSILSHFTWADQPV